MNARQLFSFSYSLMADQAGGISAIEKVLADWDEDLKRKELEWRATHDKHWGESEEAAENLRGLFSDFSGATSSAAKGAN